MRKSSAEELRENGFVVLRGEVDPVPIADEVDRVLVDGAGDDQRVMTLAQGSGTVTFQYAPMMCERTPVSLILLDRFAGLAAQLLGRAVLPGRAKGTRYHGDTGWHRDSEHDIPSLAVVMYLDSVDGTNGALRILAGSHADRTVPLPRSCSDLRTTGEAVGTVPGDVIVFDERVIHGSSGGRQRRQWRVDYVIDPRDDDETSKVRAWFAQIDTDEEHDPGYDPKRYPSYGSHWRSRDRPWTARLAQLGVYR